MLKIALFSQVPQNRFLKQWLYLNKSCMITDLVSTSLYNRTRFYEKWDNSGI